MKPTCIYIFILWVLLVWQDRVLLCYRTPVEVEWWLSLARDRKYIIGLLSLGKYKWWKEKWRPDRDMVWILVGVRGCVAVDAGHSLVTLLSLSVSVKDRSLHKPSRQVTYIIISSIYLGMGAWKTCCSLVVGSGSFWTDCQGFFLVDEVLALHWV